MRTWLGLDLGIASIGWAVVGLDDAGAPARILRMGTHLFESGTEGDAERGRDESRAGPRRLARQQRKLFRRRALRRRRLLKVLQSIGLLPPGDIATPQGIDALFKALDAELRNKWERERASDHRERQLLPYRLRAAAVEQRLEPYEVGRALYHLNQRRGFLSNRRDKAAAPPSEDGKPAKEDPSVVRAEIGELQRMIEAAGCGTIGALFARFDPTAPAGGERIRDRWTAREMFLHEFDRIWTEQARHCPAMTREARQAAQCAIFYQRPLRSSSHLIGACELVEGKKRAAMGVRVAQRFRMLQRVNDLLVQPPGDQARPLTREERAVVLSTMERDGDQTFAALRRLLGLKSAARFNLERGGEKKLPGHRTDSKLRLIFGDRWDTMSEADKDSVVEDLLCFEKPDALARRGVRRWGLHSEAAESLGETLLEPGYAAHSRQALTQLVTRMEDGTPYATARKEEFGQSGMTGEPLDLLPPVEEALGEVRNPAVTRSLTELRKLVNAIIRRFGKPEAVRVELARELKRARKHRERLTKENREREAQRERAAAHILRETTVQRPSRDDIERYLLWQECAGICPYTGRSIGLTEIVGRHPQFDVEHIWPLSRSLDNGFANKTLCYHEENRSRKKNRTPFEAYHGTPAWDDIIERVRRFKGDAAQIKLERFQTPALPEGFAERHLSETRYISTKAAEYVGLLYGGAGGVDALGVRRVFTVTGGLTYHLRREWMLDAALGGKDEKNRRDHRHHAIDALVVAVTTPRAVQQLQVAAEQASAAGRRLFAPMDPPWAGFMEAAFQKVAAINVSFRQSKRVSGKLHADSLYSKPHGPDGQRRIRKPVAALSDKEVGRIVDPRVRQEVQRRLEASGKPAKDTFKDERDLPFVTDERGIAHPVRTVRIAVEDTLRTVAAGPRERFVASTQGSNHHVEVWRTRRRGGPAGELSVVPLLDVRRHVRVPETPDRSIRYTLAIGEYVMVPTEGGVRLYRVTATAADRVVLVEHADGRERDERVRAKEYVRLNGTALAAEGVRKVTVSYLGEVRPAND